MMGKVIAAIAGVAALAAIARIGGHLVWSKEIKALHAQLESGRVPPQSGLVSFAEFEGLPEPVIRYFRRVLKDGQPIIDTVAVTHSGTFNMGTGQSQWKHFVSEQAVLTRRPGFIWDARIAMFPGMPVHVVDAYVGGQGVLHGKLLGLVSVVDVRGTPDIAKGELMRFMAESAWYPTALLPSQGVRWEAAGADSAWATMADAKVSVTLLFTFNKEGLIDTVKADARGRMVGKDSVPTPWQGRFWDYQQRGGMTVPLQGEVAWLLPDGPAPYWKGRIETIAYR